MTDSPRTIAVIISTYNAAHFLRLTLEGYANQRDDRFTIYIADDGSDSEVAEVVKDYQNILSIHHLWHEDHGYRRAGIINQAIRKVEEPYILLTDADCVPLPDMIRTHKSVAKPGTFIRGSRILLSETITAQICQKKHWNSDLSLHQWLQWRLQGRINRILPLVMPVMTSRPNTKMHGIRGCHFTFWKDDIERVNGFDSSYEGWGREDSDLAARLFHAGVKRRNLYGMPVLHLWHKEASRDQLADNDLLLEQCLKEKRIRALQGLDAI